MTFFGIGKTSCLPLTRNSWTMNMNNEIWRDIPGFEGDFQVSNHARVRSCDRYITDSIGRTKFYPSKILSQFIDVGGYYTVKLHNRPMGYSKSLKVHRLVCAAFKGFDMQSNLVIDHIDGNKLNNDLSNLEPVTVAENNNRARLLNPNYRPGGVPHFVEEDVIKIKELYNSGKYTQVQIAEMYGVKLRFVNNVINGKTQVLCFRKNRENRSVKYTKSRWKDSHWQDGELGVNSKITNEQAKEIRLKWLSGIKQNVLADEYGVCKQSISLIIKNKTYKDKNYVFESKKNVHFINQ